MKSWFEGMCEVSFLLVSLLLAARADDDGSADEGSGGSLPNPFELLEVHLRSCMF